MTMVLAGEPNLRDVIAFPKNQAGVDPMSGAPSEVTQEQLLELGIKLLRASELRFFHKTADEPGILPGEPRSGLQQTSESVNSKMSSGDSERSAAGLTALPTVEQLQRSGEGYDEQGVRQAFDAFRRHTAQLQAQLRVLQAAHKTSNVEPTGHAVRMDSLHLIRAAAEFADTLERDAQTASATQLQRTEEEVRKKQNELQEREAEIERYRSRVGAPALGDPHRRQGRGPRPARQGERRRDARAARGRDTWEPASRAVAAPGDRAHERRPGRGRADARVGPRAGDRGHGPRAEGRRAAPRGRRPRRARDQPGRAVDRRRERQRDRPYRRGRRADASGSGDRRAAGRAPPVRSACQRSAGVGRRAGEAEDDIPGGDNRGSSAARSPRHAVRRCRHRAGRAGRRRGARLRARSQCSVASGRASRSKPAFSPPSPSLPACSTCRRLAIVVVMFVACLVTVAVEWTASRAAHGDGRAGGCR